MGWRGFFLHTYSHIIGGWRTDGRDRNASRFTTCTRRSRGEFDWVEFPFNLITIHFKCGKSGFYCLPCFIQPAIIQSCSQHTKGEKEKTVKGDTLIDDATVTEWSSVKTLAQRLELKLLGRAMIFSYHFLFHTNVLFRNLLHFLLTVSLILTDLMVLRDHPEIALLGNDSQNCL